MNSPIVSDVSPALSINAKEFTSFQSLVNRELGIYLPAHKGSLIVARLNKRLTATGCRDYASYFQLIQSPDQQPEKKLALELITTNETSFFREIKHFHFLESILPANRTPGSPYRIWSAASSSGEEAYSIAMVMAEVAGRNWQVIGSDINSQVIAKAKKAIYPHQRLSAIPLEYQRKYCRKGLEEFAGYFRITPLLRAKVSFEQINLINDFIGLGLFDVIFLRNVMIYFDKEVQTKLLQRVAKQLKPGGYLLVGHAESLHGLQTNFRMQRAAIYQLDDRKHIGIKPPNT